MSTGFHRMGANVAGKLPGFSNKAFPGSGPSYPLLDLGVQLQVEGHIPAVDPAHPETELSPPVQPAMGKAQAVQSGYTGDQCSNCQSMRMKVSGHCMVCEDCGTTTGCS